MGGGDGDELEIRCRMHRADGSEDAGTGSANAALMGLLASFPVASSGSSTSVTAASGLVAARIVQGVEMGRPSELRGTAERLGGGGGAGAVGAVRAAPSNRTRARLLHPLSHVS
jgi:predicted PhzF superfamily epimerase YddE/YHI9